MSGNFWTDLEKDHHQKMEEARRKRAWARRGGLVNMGVNRKAQEDIVRAGTTSPGLIERAKLRLSRMNQAVNEGLSPVLERLQRVNMNNVFGSDLGDEPGVGQTRPAATRTGNSSGAGSAGRGPVRNTTRGAFDPDRYEQPQNARRDRLSAPHGKQQSGKMGGTFGGYGGSGIKGATSSYNDRSMFYTFKNLESRAKLTRAGFWAYVVGEFGKQEMEYLNKQVVDGGQKGGFAALNPVEREQALKRYVKGKSMFSQAAQFAIGKLAEVATIGLGIWDLAFIYGGSGGPIAANLLAASNQLSERIQILGAGGTWNDVAAAAAIQEKYGSFAAMQAIQEQVKNSFLNDAIVQRFFKESANDIAGDIIGVSGRDAFDSLKYLNRYAIDASDAEARGNFERADALRAMQSRLGTKDD